MLIVKLDPASDLDVRIPTTPDGLIGLGAAYLARETALPPAERCPAPDLEALRDCLTRAREAVRAAETSEADRAESSAAREAALDEAIPLLEKAITRLKLLHEENLASLERWGISTKVAKTGKISVSKPKNRPDWAALLSRYVEREGAQAPAERLTSPPLERLAALEQAVRTGGEGRVEGRTTRAAAIQRRNEALLELSDFLEVASAVLTLGRYGRRISRDLAQWGFNVVARAATPEAPPAPEATSPQGA